MPNEPRPYKLRDWQKTARAFDRLVFDPNAKGEYLPLLWWDDSHVNGAGRTFGLPSYVGYPAMRDGANHEAITCLGAILGATVAGIDKSKTGKPKTDKSKQGQNWSLLGAAYYQAKSSRLVLNRSNTTSGQSFWYELFPQIIFAQIADRYPRQPKLTQIARDGADRWYDAAVAMGGKAGNLNTEGVAFDFGTMKLAQNGRWKEPDAAAGIAYLEYLAYRKTGDKRYWDAANWGLMALERRKENPLYEVLFLYAPITAARMNAEEKRNYDVGKLLNWCFTEGSAARPGWGVMTGNWGGYDCDGLAGSVTDNGGYAFALNTFVSIGAILPVARYDDRYARALGKWAMNAVNAARLFYPDELPQANQSGAAWKGDPAACIAYEGLHREWKGVSPRAMGDPTKFGWAKTDFGLYGSAYAGLLAGIVAPTNVERILRLDLLATDFARPRAYPTYLYYNPYSVPKTVTLEVGESACDLYDAARDDFAVRGVRGTARFIIAPDEARVIVVAPAGGKALRQDGRTLINEVVVDYGANRR